MRVLSSAASNRPNAELQANDAALRAIRSLPPERVGRAKAVLVETVLVLLLAERWAPLGRTQLLARIADVLPDLAGTLDEPIWPVVMAAGALVDGRAPGAEQMLRLCLFDYYRPRADASFGRWRGQISPEQEQVVE